MHQGQQDKTIKKNNFFLQFSYPLKSFIAWIFHLFIVVVVVFVYWFIFFTLDVCCHCFLSTSKGEQKLTVISEREETVDDKEGEVKMKLDQVEEDRVLGEGMHKEHKFYPFTK